MSGEQNDHRVVFLMRHGMRAEDSPSAGLKTDDTETERGDNYIRDAMSVEESDRPYERFFFAPPLVCKQTIQALINHSAIVSLGKGRKIQVAEELYSTHPGWASVIQALGGQNMFAKKTLKDFREAGDLKFILAEGERVFSFIQRQGSSLDMDSGILCVMPSPLIEAVMIYTWEQDDPEFRPPLGFRKMLDYVDYFPLIFMRGKYEFGIRRSYQERVGRKRKEAQLASQIVERLGPVIGQKRT